MPVINPMFAIHRILCPVDFSEPSARALEYALGLAERLGAEVDVVHVFQFPTFAVEDLALPLYLQENLSQRLRERLEQLLIEKAGEGPKATARVLEGVPHVEIMEAAPKGGISSSWAPMGARGCRTCCWGVWQSGWCAVPRCRC
jgi:nucleotide-binding universal stress UspA family protein